MRVQIRVSVVALCLAACGPGAEVTVDPQTYLQALDHLVPGDTMRFMPGVYEDCLNIQALHGTPGQPITLTGPESGAPAILVGANCQPLDPFPPAMIRLRDSSFLVIRNLELDGQSLGVVGLQAGYGTPPVHSVTVDNLYVHDNDTTSQITGISVFTTSWDWEIRNNRLERVGLGLYLGNSDGSDPFIRGTIENNVVIDPKGYGMQIKHQFMRVPVAGMPQSDSVTYIRHNVFIKSSNAVTGNAARPNLLIGDVPDDGVGARDRYEIYGNFLFQNDSDSEPLFQGEGNYAFHDNVLFNTFSGNGMIVQPHNGLPKQIAIYRNTIVTQGQGILVTGGDATFSQIVQGNAVFANGMPAIDAADTNGNTVGTFSEAAGVFNDTNAMLGRLDLYPRAGELMGAALDYSTFSEHADWDVDFNGDAIDSTRRGAYSGDGNNPGWMLAAMNKLPIEGDPPPPADAGTAPPPDAGFDDSGAPIDGGFIPPPGDAGQQSSLDADTATQNPDATATQPRGDSTRRATSGGCTCALSTEAPPGALALLIVPALLLGRRRRQR